MNKTEKYKHLVKDLISHQSSKQGYIPGRNEIQVVFDDERGHYYLVDISWNGCERVHGFIIHMDIKQDKIWIQQDWTLDGLSDELRGQGVPMEDIVLVYNRPIGQSQPGYAGA